MIGKKLKRKRSKKKRTCFDQKWSKEVKERDRLCLVCGQEDYLNAHHLIPREIEKYRYDKENGITLCPSHHRFSFKLSAHQNPIAFLMWFQDKYPEWYLKIIKKINEIE